MKIHISPLVQWFFCCFLFIGCMILGRILYAQNIRYIFLVWNLFLATIPFWISSQFTKIILKNKIIQAIVFLCWLLFFPNSLYIVTDLIHLQKTTSVPIWFDAILLFSSSSLGLVLAFASLLHVEQYLSNFFKQFQVNVLMVLLLFVGSYGVYLGRFKRWNSWDIIKNPLAIAYDILETFLHPLENLAVWSVVLLLTGLYALSWFLVKVFTTNLKQHKSYTSKN